MNPMRLVSLIALAFASVLTLTGCDDQNVRAPGFEEDHYKSEITVEGQWSVKFNGTVNIEVDKAGTVNIYGFAQSNGNGGTYFPDAKVSGPAKFSLHSFDRVTVVDGASVSAFSCSTIRARSGTTVDAYNCGTIEAYGAVKSVRPHGSTKLEKFPEPDSLISPAPATQPAPPSQPTTAPRSATPASAKQINTNKASMPVSTSDSNQVEVKALLTPMARLTQPNDSAAGNSNQRYAPAVPNPTLNAMK